MSAAGAAPAGAGRRAVAIGGGHGLSRSLLALDRAVEHVTAVVTAADDGGSSGRLRRDLDVIPPGDLRMALAALSPEPSLVRLLQYRFDRGELTGHSLGNLALVALQELHGGDLVAALDEIAAMLGVRGRVLPCTTTPVRLHAKSADGAIVEGQAAVASTLRVDRVWLEPADAPGCRDAVAAIDEADLIVLGPGSLYTSLIPNLLIGEIGAAVRRATVPVVFVANLREQPGETEGMDLAAHLEALAQHVPGLRISHLVAHGGPTPTGPGRALSVAGEDQLPVDELVVEDLLDGEDGHDPEMLRRVLQRIAHG